MFTRNYGTDMRDDCNPVFIDCGFRPKNYPLRNDGRKEIKDGEPASEKSCICSCFHTVGATLMKSADEALSFFSQPEEAELAPS